MYDGTMTITDPHLIEELGTPDGAPDEVRAYVVYDTDPEPPDGDGIGYVLALSDTHERYDSCWITGDYGDDSHAGNLMRAIRLAWERWRDHVARGS